MPDTQPPPQADDNAAEHSQQPSAAKSHSAPAVSKVPDKSRKRSEHLAKWLRQFLGMPAWVRIPVLILLFMLYSPPLVLNLLSVMQVSRTNRLRVYSYPQFVYVWPVIAWGFVFAGCVQLGIGEGFFAWTYLLLVVYTIITMGFDFKFGGWLGIIATAAVVVAALGWWGSARQVPVFQPIGEMLSGWLTFPSSWIVTLCTILLVVYAVMMTLRRFNKRLRIHSNLVIIDTLLGKVDRNTRASYGIHDDVPDVNELLMGMCSAFMLEGKGTVASHAFKNVPGGPLVTRVIEDMLAATAIEDETDLFSDEGEDELAD